MATKPAGQGVSIKLPDSLDIKDLLTIGGVIVTLTVGWGLFSTRLTLLEHEVVDLRAANQAHEESIDKLQQHVSRLSAHQQDDELIIDQAFNLLRKPTPIRRATN